MRLFNLTFLMLTVFSVAQATTQLASIFTESMVLQQQDQAVIWGTDEPGQAVKVSAGWGQSASATTDNKGKWQLKLTTPVAGGPYKLHVQGSSELEYHDILIGEVWLCSGQSNMEMPLKGKPNEPINGSQEAILTANQDRIRVFQVERNPSNTPIDSVNGQWIASNTSTAGEFSATAYFFAKKLQATLDVPIGLIVTSWGGSSAEAWTDAPTLESFTDAVDQLKRAKNVQQQPSQLYNGMLHPLIGYTIKGAIWYQGESNRNRASEYDQLVTAMVTSWREQWNQGDFPFYYVQIAPFNYGKKTNAAYLREAQLHTMQTLKNSGMAVTLDIGDANCIHPREKKTVGERLAYWALSKDYGFPHLEATGPIYKSHTIIDGNKISILFDGAPMGINSFGKELSGFTIAGADKVFHPAYAKIGRPLAQLIVWSPAVAKPVAVRYAFENTPETTLFSTSGLPASSFRTDDWAE